MERYGILVNKEEDQPWKYNQRRGVGLYSNGVIGGFSWPPRSYGCSFCKREFRSAQALGGHMNVHRRERARLRQYSPPWDTPSPNANNPNINNHNKTSIPNLNIAPASPAFPPCSPPSPSSTLTSPLTNKNSAEDQVKFSLFGHNYTLLKAPVSIYGEAMIRDLAVDEQNTMKLELAMGRNCKDHHLEDGLDLELRLGFP